MFNDIESFLNVYIGEDSSRFFLEYLKLFDDINYQDHIFPLKMAMADIDNHDPEETISFLNELVKDNYFIIIKSMGIKLNKDIPMSMLYDVLFSLTKIETYENKEEIKSTIDSSETNEQTLTEFVKIFRNKDPLNYLEYVDSVSVDLINRITELCNKELSYKADTEWVDKSVVKNNANKFFNKYQGTYIRKLIAEGYPICTNEDIYVKALETHFSTYDPTIEEYSKELLGIAVSTTTTDVLLNAKRLTDSFVTDANEMINVNALMTKMYTELFPYVEK